MELAFGILKNISGNNSIIMGLETSNQLQQNLRIIKDVSVDNTISDAWWIELPIFPERLLNPFLWN